MEEKEIIKGKQLIAHLLAMIAFMCGAAILTLMAKYMLPLVVAILAGFTVIIIGYGLGCLFDWVENNW